MLRAIISDGWVAPRYRNPDFVEQEIERDISFVAATNLFATTVAAKTFPDDAEQLSPVQYMGDRRLERFLGRQ